MALLKTTACHAHGLAWACVVRWTGAGILAALLAVTAGCSSGRYPVSGRVTYEDGSPVSEGTVIGLMEEGSTSVSVQGRIEADGRFSWGTDRPGDGAKPGKYLVAVIPRGLGDEETAQGKLPAVASKFSNPQTSGIEFEVKAGRNELNITVSKPKS
jgi:hypothetical protein